MKRRDSNAPRPRTIGVLAQLERGPSSRLQVTVAAGRARGSAGQCARSPSCCSP